MTSQIICHQPKEVIYLITNIIFIYITQDHQQEVTSTTIYQIWTSWKPNLLYLRYPFSFSCNLFPFPMNFFFFFWNVILVNIQLLLSILLLLYLFSLFYFVFWFHYLIPTSYILSSVSSVCIVKWYSILCVKPCTARFEYIAVANCKQWYTIFCIFKDLLINLKLDLGAGAWANCYY